MVIGFRRGTSFTLDSMESHPLGQFLFLTGNLGSMPCTLATLYAPNRDQVSFIAATFKKLTDFTHGCVLLAGDFNSPLETLLDTSLCRSWILYRRLAFIRKCLHEAQLMDVWRIIHPKAKDYTQLHPLFTFTSHLLMHSLFSHRSPSPLPLHIF